MVQHWVEILAQYPVTWDTALAA